MSGASRGRPRAAIGEWHGCNTKRMFGKGAINLPPKEDLHHYLGASSVSLSAKDADTNDSSECFAFLENKAGACPQGKCAFIHAGSCPEILPAERLLDTVVQEALKDFPEIVDGHEVHQGLNGTYSYDTIRESHIPMFGNGHLHYTYMDRSSLPVNVGAPPDSVGNLRDGLIERMLWEYAPYPGEVTMLAEKQHRQFFVYCTAKYYIVIGDVPAIRFITRTAVAVSP